MLIRVVLALRGEGREVIRISAGFGPISIVQWASVCLCVCEKARERGRNPSLHSIKICAAPVMMFDVRIFFWMSNGGCPRMKSGEKNERKERKEGKRPQQEEIPLIKRLQNDLH